MVLDINAAQMIVLCIIKELIYDWLAGLVEAPNKLVRMVPKTVHILNLTCGGKDHPHGIVLRRRSSHTGQENFRTPAPTHT